MKFNVISIFYLILQFVTFLFVLVGTLLDIFRSRDTTLGKPCLTLWGDRLRCSSSENEEYVENVWLLCPARISRFRLAQGCAIISLALYCAAFALGCILLYCCSYLRLVCLVINSVGFVSLSVVWVAMAVSYNKDDDINCWAMKRNSSYGPGFVLLVVAWILNMVSIVVLLVPYITTKANEDGQTKHLAGQE